MAFVKYNGNKITNATTMTVFPGIQAVLVSGLMFLPWGPPASSKTRPSSCLCIAAPFHAAGPLACGSVS